jgi:nitrate reductase NapAB chaperone NapD
MSAPWQVASFILHCRPGQAQALAAALQAMPGAQVRGIEGERLIVLLEAESDALFAERVAALQARPEIALANLVFHQIDFDEE